jgi:DNA polymerase
MTDAVKKAKLRNGLAMVFYAGGSNAINLSRQSGCFCQLFVSRTHMRSVVELRMCAARSGTSAGVLFGCIALLLQLQSRPMEEEIDIRKVASQHLEMDKFFAGDFTVRSEKVRAQEQKLQVEAGRAAVEMERIAGEVRACRRCPLGSSRTNAVPGEGSVCGLIAFVGEAPGADEDAQGRPFVGKAGKLLDKIIAAMGLNREEVFIGNILKCRPPENRDPRPEEIVKCLPYLQQQLEVLKPEIIVALGAHAAKTLLDTNKSIGQLRGKLHDYYPGEMAKPIKLMATYHPAYLLRNYSDASRRAVWEDMQEVLKELGLPIPEHGRK